MREGLPYEDWKKEVKIWMSFTDLAKVKQGGALFLSLEGRNRDAVLAEIDNTDTIHSDAGLNTVIKALDKIYLKDKTESGFEAFDSFIKFRRPQTMSLSDYITDFNIKYSKLKCYEMSLPEGVLAYALLTCANLPPEQEQLCRATCKELTYKEMKQQIERTHASPKEGKDVEPFYGCDFYEDTGAVDEDEYPEYHEPDSYNQQNAEDTFFSQQSRFRKQTNVSPRVNMPDEFGKPTRCSFCHSIYHYVSRCPDAQTSQKSRGAPTYRRQRGRGGPRRFYPERRL